MIRKKSNDIDQLPWQTDFLLRLAQGRLLRLLTVRFATPPWKADLPRMRLEILGALRQQNSSALVPSPTIGIRTAARNGLAGAKCLTRVEYSGGTPANNA